MAERVHFDLRLSHFTLVHACAAGQKSAKSDMGSKLGYIHAFGSAICADISSALLRLALRTSIA